MTKIITALAMFLVLTACTATTVVREKAASGFDAALSGAEQMTCNDSSIGAIKRKYCSTKEGCQRWINFCFPTGAVKETWDNAAK